MQAAGGHLLGFHETYIYAILTFLAPPGAPPPSSKLVKTSGFLRFWGSVNLKKPLVFTSFEEGGGAPGGAKKVNMAYIYTFRENQEDVPPRLAFGVYIYAKWKVWSTCRKPSIWRIYTPNACRGGTSSWFSRNVYIYTPNGAF